MLPQSNARLVSVAADGTSEDWDQAEGPGAPIWSGDADAYVTDKVATAFSQSAGSLAKIQDTRIIVSAGTLRNTEFKTGQVITFTWAGKRHTRRVLDVDGAYMPGAANYVRLHLEPA